MNSLPKKLLVAAVLALGLAAGTVSAGTVCDPKDPKCVPPPKIGDCSPGYFKNHLTYWVGIYCDNPNGGYGTSCAELLRALTCKGNDAICGRSAAASYLNGVSGCTES